MSIMRAARLSEAVTKTAKLLARDSVQVTQRGGQPHVKYRADGSVEYVNLPSIPENPSQEYLNALEGFLDHEVAHVLFTDQKAVIQILERECKAHRLDPSKTAMLQNTFEDVRIEKRMRAEYQGAGYNLSNALKSIIDGPITELIKAANKISDPNERRASRVGSAMVIWCRALADQTEAKLFMDANDLWPDFEPILKLFPDFPNRLNTLADSAASARLAVDMMKALKDASKTEEEREDEAPSPPPPSLGSKEDGKSDEGPEEGDGDEDDVADEGEGENEGGAGGQDDDGEAEADGEGGDADEESEGADRDGDSDDDSDGGPSNGEGDKEDDDDGEGEGKTNRTLTEAMRLLDPTHRKLISDYNKKKKSVAEIARENGMSNAAVESDLCEARRKLKFYMKGMK